MFIRNGQSFNIYDQHEIDGVTYPRGFFNTPEIRAEFGITEQPDPAPQPVVVTAVTALQGLLAIEAAGLADAYMAWANDPARTFAERAFIDKAAVWRRDDPVLLAGAAALGLNAAQIDAMYAAAAV